MTRAKTTLGKDDAADAVRAMALARLRAPESRELRDRLASGALSAEGFSRDVVREWATAGVRDGRAGVDEGYQRLLGLSARVDVGRSAGRGDDWDFVLEGTNSSRRSRAGAFYTPARLIDWVLDAALEPAIADARSHAARDADAVLALRVCDPACGSGRFLVAAARRLGDALSRDRAKGSAVTESSRAAALRDVVRECVYGVDIDDVAVAMCREALAGVGGGGGGGDEDVRGAVWERVREGDSLVGATVGEWSRERADVWCARFFDEGAGATSIGRRFFHWGVEFAGVFRGEGVGEMAESNAAPSLNRLDADSAFPPPPGRRGISEHGGFDVVVGNPPFLNQLESGTAVDGAMRAFLRARFDGAARGYADVAAAFLLLAVELAREGGRVGFVLPRSLLAVEHAGRVRERVLRAAAPTALWGAASGAFASASVATCAVTLSKGGKRRGELRRAHGVEFTPLSSVDLDADELMTRPSWSHLLADADGTPRVEVSSLATIGDFADATADFRDQYYGLQGYIVDSAQDHPRRPKLITSGLIAPLDLLWGKAPTRIHKQRWLHPRVDLDAIDAAAARGDATARMLSAWAKARLVPKALLATQTRVLEVVADEKGELLPCVPVITVVPRDPEDLARIVAALSSPIATVVAFTRHAGAGMSADAIKLSAKQVMALPAPERDGRGQISDETLALAETWWRRRRAKNGT